MKKEKIILEGLALVEGHFSGVGQYTLGILRGLDEEIDSLKYKGKEWPEVIVLIPWNMVDRFKSFKFKHIGYKKFPLTFRVMSKLWYSGLMPPIDIWCGRGFYVFPRFGKMPLLFSKYAVVVHDLSYELYPQYSDKGSAEFISRAVKKSIPKAFKVITVSDNARKEIVDFYKLSKDSVPVATPAADQRVFYRRSDQEVAKVKERYGIEQDYILALSNLEPRKNLRVLVDAYCALPKRIREKNALLLVGVSGWKTDALFNHITEKVKEGYNIIRPSHYVSDEDKPAILSGAKMLVYPSHYEGFGMPPLEALACGTPVISANNSSLPQAVGSAGLMVDVEDEKETLSAIEGCFRDYDKVAADVLTTGPRQAEKFSWVNSARVFIDVAKESRK